MHPVLATICGLVLAGGTHGARAAVRPAATLTTGGLMNPVVSFVEDAVSGTLAVLAILLPMLAFALVLLVAVWTDQKAFDAHETAAHTLQFRAATTMGGPAWRCNLYDQRLYKAL